MLISLGALGAVVTVLLLSSFVRIFTSLCILRAGLGLSGGFGIVLFGLAITLALLVAAPQLDKVGGLAKLSAAEPQNLQPKLEEAFRPFLEKNTDKEVIASVSKLEISLNHRKTDAAPSFEAVSAAFVVSELREAFSIGLMLLIPFFVLDLVVANVLMVLNVTQLSSSVVALPLKLLLFFAVDGWSLIVARLLGSYE